MLTNHTFSPTTWTATQYHLMSPSSLLLMPYDHLILTSSLFSLLLSQPHHCQDSFLNCLPLSISYPAVYTFFHQMFILYVRYCFMVLILYWKVLPRWCSSKRMSASAGDTRDAGSIPGVGNGNPLQYSCLKNRMDRRLAGYRPWGLKESNMTQYACILVNKLTLCSVMSNSLQPGGL